jgi:AraC-like DNA-binding protein
MPELAMTGLARIPLIVLQSAEAHGLDRDELMRAAGLTEEELADADARISMVKVWSVWRAAIERSSDPGLGVQIGTTADARSLGLVGYSMLYSTNLREALQRLQRYGRILSDATKFQVEEDGDRVALTFAPAPKLDSLIHPAASRFSALLTISREITHHDIVPLEVHFSFARPTDTSSYRDCFRSTLEFESTTPKVVLRGSDLDLPVVTRDPNLGNYLEQLAEGTLGSLESTSSFADQVRRTLWLKLSSGRPDLDTIASSMSTSVRTLQRRLEAEGTSFAALLDAFRRKMAEQLLRDPALAVYEIAFLLGYSEPSTFFRACRRWYGASPRQLRHRQLA